MGKLLLSHRYNRLPLLPSDPGGVQQELIVEGLPGANVNGIRTQLFSDTKNSFEQKSGEMLCKIFAKFSMNEFLISHIYIIKVLNIIGLTSKMPLKMESYGFWKETAV